MRLKHKQNFFPWHGFEYRILFSTNYMLSCIFHFLLSWLKVGTVKTFSEARVACIGQPNKLDDAFKYFSALFFTKLMLLLLACLKINFCQVLLLWNLSSCGNMIYIWQAAHLEENLFPGACHCHCNGCLLLLHYPPRSQLFLFYILHWLFL